MKKFDALKERLANGKDFGAIFSYFLDHFGEDPDFFDLGRQSAGKPIEAFLCAVGQHVLGEAVTQFVGTFVEIPEVQFIHGPCYMNGRTASAIYFGDVDLGLVAFLPTQRDPLTHFSRFSCRALPRGYMGSSN